MSETKLESPASLPEEVAAAAERGGGRRNSFLADFLDWLNQFQFLHIGPTIVFVVRRLGVKGAVVVLMTFLAGVALGVVPVWLGFAPRFVVSDKYKKGLRKAADSERTLPPNLEGVPVGRSKPEWLQPYVSWTQTEGEAMKAAGKFAHYGVDAVSYELQNPTKPFVWLLNANPGFDLDGRAFRVTREEFGEAAAKGQEQSPAAREFVQPLKHVKEGASISFEVPACEKNDRLYVVLFARWQQDFKEKVDISSTFQSVVK